MVDWKCLETGSQIYHMVFVSITPGGSAPCDYTPAIFHLKFDPLPQVCTVTSMKEKGVDRCDQACD